MGKVNVGVVIRGKDDAIAAEAKRRGLGVVCTPHPTLPLRGQASPGGEGGIPFERALVVEAGTVVPWDQVGHGLDFVKRWDAAVPLWRYGVLAKDLGTPEERKRTEALMLDLRVPVYACELLFVRGDGAGAELMRVWEEERNPLTLPSPPGERAPDSRLAFLRAVARVKPRLCVLPTSWFKAAPERAAKDERARRGMAMASASAGVKLVKVEVSPGRFVRCRKGQEAMVKARFGGRRKR